MVDVPDWVPDGDDVTFDPPGDLSWKETLTFGILGDDGAANALRGRVLGWVATWIVGGILVVRNETISWVLMYWDALIASTGTAGAAFADAVGVVAEVPLTLASSLSETLTSLLTSLGPFAFPAYVIIIGLMILFVDQVAQFLVERIKGAIGVW